MNHNLKSKLGGLVFFEFDDLNCIEFNVLHLNDGTFNLVADIGYVDTENEEYPYEYGYSMRTTIFESDLVEIGKKINAYFELGMFDHLVFLPEAFCIDENGEEEFAFDWSDYMTDTPVLLN